LNVFIGHYRDALAKFAAKTLDFEASLQAQATFAAEAVSTMLLNPIMLEDFKSYMIVGFGLIAAVVAVIKSYGLEDPYPGYGKIHKFQARLASIFNDRQTAYLQDLNDLTDDFVDKINGEIGLLEGNRLALHYRSNDQSKLIEKYKDWLTNTSATGNALYAYYREENLKAREEKKEPKSFAKFKYELPDTASDVPEAKAIEIFNIDEIKQESEKMTKKLNSDLRHYQDKFKDLTNLSKDQALQENFSDTDLERPE
jgi:hypothetical protein